jgi:hypothetical protein
MERPRDGANPEKINRFKLMLHLRGATVTGTFQDLTARPVLPKPIKNGKRFGERACFDVIDSTGDMRWCVFIRQGRLIGVWSEGPEGGPLLDGMGVGARMFAISADHRH